MSLDTPTTIDTAGVTTTIVDDGMTVSNAMSTHHVPDPLTSTSESIKDFLAKPYLIYQGGWAETDLAGSLLFGGLGLKTDGWLETITPWHDKIKGFSMVRGTLVLRLQLNATPFHAGKLLLHFLPAVSMHNELVYNDANYVAMHNWSLTTRTQQPSVELDCRETAAEMRIPYIVPTDYYVLGTLDSSMPKVERGSVYLSVLAALRAGSGTPNIDYSFWMSWEDVELVAPLVPQSGGKGKRKGIGAMKEKEAKAMAATPVANALSVAGKVASTLGAIPLLEPLATPASWVLNAAAGLASAFGWSKPTNTMVAAPVSRQFNRFAATSDGTDNVFPLAMSCTNHITTTTAKTITDDDEMSFAFLKQVPAWIETVNWTTEENQGTVIYGKEIGPRTLFSRKPLTRNTTTVYLDSMAPFAYLASNFTQYRGAIKVKIRIAKTDFHSGRLLITFTPRCNPTVLPSATSSFYSLREVIDIRAGNEMEFTLPYMMPTQYISVEDNLGFLQIEVMNQLRAPETVPQSVDLLFFFSGGEDYELAVPGYSPNAVNWPPFSPQSFGRDVAIDTPLVAEGIGGTPVVRADLGAAEHCVGEIFTSVRQMLARYNQMWSTAPNPAPGIGFNIALWPYYSSCQLLKTDGTIVTPARGGDPYSLIAPMYAYYRGGMKVAINSSNLASLDLTIDPSQVKAATGILKTASTYNGTLGGVPWAMSPNTAPSGTAISDQYVGTCGAELPYYCRTPISNVVATAGNDYPTTLLGTLEATIPRSCLCYKGANTHALYRAIAEDFQFTYFVGCPPLRRDTVALTASPPPLLRATREMPLADDGSFDEVKFFATA